jgi:hypothetical protein
MKTVPSKTVGTTGWVDCSAFPKIKEFLNNPAHELPTVDSARMVLYLGERFSILLSIQSPASVHLYTQPFRGFVSPITGSGIDLDHYALPTDWDSDIYRSDIHITFDRTDYVPKYSVAFFNGFTHLVEGRSREPNSVSIKVFEHPRSSLEWVFSRSTFHPIGVVASDPVASRKQYIIKTLGEMAHPSSIPILQQMLRDPAHFVRWSAIQALGKCNRDAALEGLAFLTNDLHPHIQAAAIRALAAA